MIWDDVHCHDIVMVEQEITRPPQMELKCGTYCEKSVLIQELYVRHVLLIRLASSNSAGVSDDADPI